MMIVKSQSCNHKTTNATCYLLRSNYLDVLERTDSYDTYIARVIAIWLKHKNNCEINKLMQRRLPSIPSYKFVSLMRQISPTLRQGNSLFSQNIRNLIRRMTLEHPYHCIPILLMLKNYQLDSMHCHDDDDSLIVATKSKVEAAEELIRELKETKIKQIIDETDFIANALIQIAYTSVPKGNFLVVYLIIKMYCLIVQVTFLFRCPTTRDKERRGNFESRQFP